jgi:hypothetical protein
MQEVSQERPAEMFVLADSDAADKLDTLAD